MQPVREFAEQSIVCSIRPYEFSVRSFFEKLIEHRERVKERVIKAGYLEPPNRRLQFVHVTIDETVAEQFRDPETVALMIDVFSGSNIERIYPVVYSSDARLLPKPVHKVLDSALYVGEENERHCVEIVHPGKYRRKSSPWQEHLGVMHHVPEPSLVNVHRYHFTPSEKQIERVERGRDEEQAYREFLESLQD